MRKKKCLRCDARMQFGMQQKFQLGQAGLIFGAWPNLLAGALELEVWFCPKCGKVEFFVPGSSELPVKQEEPSQTGEFDFVNSVVNEGIDAVSSDGMPQKKCPTCGKEHDFDYPPVSLLQARLLREMNEPPGVTSHIRKTVTIPAA